MNRPRWIQRIWARGEVRRAAPGAPIRQAWTGLGDGVGDEARAGALLRQAIVREPMSDTQLAAVRARLRQHRLVPARWTRLVQVAAALAVMLAAGMLLAAARRFLGWSASEPVGRAVPSVVSPVRRHAGRREQQPVVPPPAEQPQAEIPAATPAPMKPVVRSHRPLSHRAAPPSPASPLPESPVAANESPAPLGATSRLAEESRLLALALRKLRQDDDPAAALATLEEHAAHFGRGGALTAEADTARVEALLRLGRHSEALVRLDGMTLSATGPSRGLLAARAELRAEHGRCAAASIDFDRLLDRLDDHDAIVERSLHGRASCRAQAGDVAGARVDLEAYLARFPDGRFAADARATLGR